MRYRAQISSKLDNLKNGIELTKRGLTNRTITAEETVRNLNTALTFIEDTINLVDKEYDDRPEPRK